MSEVVSIDLLSMDTVNQLFFSSDPISKQVFNRWCREDAMPGAIKMPGGEWRINRPTFERALLDGMFSPNLHTI